ncbi:MAG TPA: DUF3237 domain-containing protein [Burkholderiales bacterium]|nr:DUF3237 domain-containing protein [Burkholderiales bacterium]
MIQTRHLFTLTADVPGIVELGATPQGTRRIATVSGGTFRGERLSGKIQAVPGGDWILVRPDGATILDVRVTLETDDRQLIYMTYRGVRHGPAEVMARLAKGEAVDPASYYFRTTPVFETAAPKYDWLNRIVSVATGRREARGPVYEVYEVL